MGNVSLYMYIYTQSYYPILWIPLWPPAAILHSHIILRAASRSWNMEPVSELMNPFKVPCTTVPRHLINPKHKCSEGAR